MSADSVVTTATARATLKARWRGERIDGLGSGIPISVAGQCSVRITRVDAGRAGCPCSHPEDTGCPPEGTVPRARCAGSL